MKEEIEEALELAKGIMDTCQGDAWERECTEEDRNRFQEIYKKYFPERKPTKEEQLFEDLKSSNEWCPFCKKMFYSKRGYSLHCEKSLKHKKKMKECVTKQ